MCLAVPGKIVKIDVIQKVAIVDFGGLKQEVRLDLVDINENHIGHYALVHVGYAIQILSPEQGEETLGLFREYADAVEKDIMAEQLAFRKKGLG
ncbi:MAG: HypC/HybG/HupF family hydrogenase formation chaperone [Methanocellales archaeon]|nr:HypC/HybG/HupF family hydrogenase formation chaperone [Methanocellales archaeon]MDD3421204.1 HypC/HybG/HupF family hydrogenase formation chaperone [Methanocellales archaeon]MDD4897910.1 HypC/HybG/HupF family hydrogenase formation chaperone [Methanocellales archaeon]MDD5446328.1 HypC/HybG/HupF family hydrogenase formation chaperone [Methanocellales archaeon]